MRAAGFFREACIRRGLVPDRLGVDLKGSLSATGRGHATDKAILAGLHGWEPESCDIDAVRALPQPLTADPRIPWAEGTTRAHSDDVRFLRFSEYKDDVLPHPNTMVFRALAGREVVFEQTWCSVGGGFVVLAGAEIQRDRSGPPAAQPHPFHDCASLAAAARSIGGTFGDVVLANEEAWDSWLGETTGRRPMPCPSTRRTPRAAASSRHPPMAPPSSCPPCWSKRPSDSSWIGRPSTTLSPQQALWESW